MSRTAASGPVSSKSKAPPSTPKPRRRVTPAPAGESPATLSPPYHGKGGGKRTGSSAAPAAHMSPAAQLKLDLIPLPRQSSRPFRTELTVEQNSLFVSNNYRGQSFVREEVGVHPETGRQILRRMTVGQTHADDRPRGVLRQQHQDAYFKLLELWGNSGYPLGAVRGKRYGIIRASAYEIVTKIYGGFDNVRAYRRTRELLRDLQAIPIVLENVYSHGRNLKDREEFTLLSEVAWSEKNVDDEGVPARDGRSLATIMLSSMVTEGFLARHFKVLLGQPYDALGASGRGRRSEIARLLYPFLDAQLVEKPVYEASLDFLAQHFGLQRYAHRSKRKEKFVTAINALKGKPILEGHFALRLELIEQRDDYVLRATRGPTSC